MTTSLSVSPDVLSRTTQARLAGRISVDSVLAIVVFVYWVAFENSLFTYSLEVGGPVFYALVNAIKLVLPFGLLFITGLPPVRMLTRGSVSIYTTLFVLFLAWAVVPTVLTGDIGTWLKFADRFVFFIGAVALWYKRPAAFAVFAKCMILYVLLAFAQLILVYATRSYYDFNLIGHHYFAGPFGVLGNVSGRFFLPGIRFPIVRLCGFWNEPTLAAASAFAAYFLGRYLVATGDRPIWRVASRACLIAGILTLSNAGYFAFGVALAIGLVFGGSRFDVLRLRFNGRRILQFAVLVPIVGLLVFVAFGRSYFAERAGSSVWLLAVVGVRSTATLEDPTNGRIELLQTAIETTKSNWAGVGVQTVGEGGITSSASAPIMWLLLTGVPGLLLLLGRELALLSAARTLVRRRPECMCLVQALAAVMAQQSSYGTWMDPNYLVLASMVLVRSTASKNHAVK
jgi:hypothetical protein